MLNFEQILAISIISFSSIIMISLCYKCYNEHYRKLREKNRLNYIKKLKIFNKIKPINLNDFRNVYEIV